MVGKGVYPEQMAIVVNGGKGLYPEQMTPVVNGGKRVISRADGNCREWWEKGYIQSRWQLL